MNVLIQHSMLFCILDRFSHTTYYDFRYFCRDFLTQHIMIFAILWDNLTQYINIFVFLRRFFHTINHDFFFFFLVGTGVLTQCIKFFLYFCGDFLTQRTMMFGIFFEGRFARNVSILFLYFCRDFLTKSTLIFGFFVGIVLHSEPWFSVSFAGAVLRIFYFFLFLCRFSHTTYHDFRYFGEGISYIIYEVFLWSFSHTTHHNFRNFWGDCLTTYHSFL